MRRRFIRHPNRIVKGYENIVLARMGVTSRHQVWSLREDAKRLLPLFAKRLLPFHLFSEVYQLMKEERWAHAHAYMCQALNALYQVALDKGSWAIAAHFLPAPDPLTRQPFGGEYMELDAVQRMLKGVDDLKTSAGRRNWDRKDASDRDADPRDDDLEKGPGRKSRRKMTKKEKAAAKANAQREKAAAEKGARRIGQRSANVDERKSSHPLDKVLNQLYFCSRGTPFGRCLHWLRMHRADCASHTNHAKSVSETPKLLPSHLPQVPIDLCRRPSEAMRQSRRRMSRFRTSQRAWRWAELQLVYFTFLELGSPRGTKVLGEALDPWSFSGYQKEAFGHV